MELLAPVGEIDSLRAAINAGADAVYFGAPRFNARLNQDINHHDIKQIADYCHLRGVKAYLALNTLIKKSELDDALSIVEQATAAKIDALIVQDFGLARLIKQRYPNTVLHASTQAGVHNLYGAFTAKAMGFSRVILSRETTLEDIYSIKNNCDIEVEVFVHGANCVSFSGNCYLSAFAHGCSGNRGRCRQPCRDFYTARADGRQLASGFLLSPKDNCLLPSLGLLRGAGIDSLKIEGRYKRPAYVAGVVSVYKRAMTDGSYSKDDIGTLQALFNRGDFCGGQMYGSDNLIEPNIATHMGECVGRVTGAENGRFTYEGKQLNRGDGIKLLREGREVGHAQISNPNVLTYVGEARAGDEVRRTTDALLNRSLLDIPSKKLQVSLSAKTEGGRLTVRLFSGGCSVDGGTDGVPAINNPLTEQRLVEVFSRTDKSPFAVSVQSCDMAEPLHFTASALNALRRELLGRLELELVAAYQNQSGAPAKPLYVCPPPRFKRYILSSDSQLADSLNEDEILVHCPASYEKAPIGAEKMLLNLPVFADCNDIAVLERSAKGYMGLVVNNLYGIELARRHGLAWIGGFGLNLLNDEWLDGHFSSLESESGKIVYAFGYPPVMTLRHCPSKTVGIGCAGCRDGLILKSKAGAYRLGRTRASGCLNTLFYSALIDNLADCGDNRSMVIDVRQFDRTAALRIIDCARNKRQAGLQGTRGLFKSGVL